MTRLIRTATVWTLACAAALAALPARAQVPRVAAVHADPRPWVRGVSAREQQLALTLFATGNREFVESRFAEALARYREAIVHWDHPAIRFNMAVCLIHLDQLVEASDNLERGMAYGAAPIGPELHSRGLTYRKLLDGQLVHVRVSCPEPEATVTLDGKVLFVGPGTVEQVTLPGEHQVVATKEGFSTASERFVLVAGKPSPYEIRLSTGLGGATVPCRVSQTRPSYFSDWSQRMATAAASRPNAAVRTLPLAISVPTPSVSPSAVAATNQALQAPATPPKTSAPWQGAEVYLQPTPPPPSPSAFGIPTSGPASPASAAGSPTPYASTTSAALSTSNAARAGSSAVQGASPTASAAAGVPTMLTANVSQARAGVPVMLATANVPQPGVVPAGVAPGGVAPACIAPACIAPAGAVPGGVAPAGVVPGGVAPSGVMPGGVAPSGVVPGVAPAGVALAGVAPPGVVPPGAAAPSVAPLSAPAPIDPMLPPSVSPPYVPPTPLPYVWTMPYLRPPYMPPSPQQAMRGAPNPTPGWPQQPLPPGASPYGSGVPGSPPQPPGPGVPAPPEPFATATARVPVHGSTAAPPATGGSVAPPSAPAAATRAPSTTARMVSSTAVSPAPPSPPANRRPAIVDDENPLLTPPPYRPLAASPYRAPAGTGAPSPSVYRAPGVAVHPTSGPTYRAPANAGAPSPSVYRASGGATHPPSGPAYRAPATSAPAPHTPAPAPASHSTPTYHAPTPTYHAPAPSYHSSPTFHR